MNKILPLICLLFILISCSGNNDLKFYYLEEHKDERYIKKTYFDTYRKKNVYSGIELYEVVLIKNYPKDIDSLKSIMLNYFDSVNIQSNDTIKFSERAMSFYPYTDKTDNFLHNTKDPYELANIYISDVASDIGHIYYAKCQNDSLKWQKTINLWHNQKDTLIYLYRCDEKK